MDHVQFEGSEIDFPVEKIQDIAPEGYTSEFFSIYADKSKISSCKQGYEVLSNRELYNLAVEAADKFGVRVDKVRSLSGKALICIQTEYHDFRIGETDVNSRLSFLNSHNGSSSVAAGTSALTVVCQNTFWNAYKGMEKFRHTAGMQDRIRFFVSALEMEHKKEKELIEYFQKLANTPVKKDHVQHVLNMGVNINARKKSDRLDVSKDNWDKGVSVRTVNRVGQIASIAEKTIHTHGQNAWGLLGIATDLSSNFFGTKDNQAVKAFSGHKVEDQVIKYIDKQFGVFMN